VRVIFAEECLALWQGALEALERMLNGTRKAYPINKRFSTILLNALEQQYS